MSESRDIKLSRIIRRMLGEEAAGQFQKLDEIGAGGGKQTNGEIIARQAIEAACAGKQWAIELVWERDEGKAPQAKPDDAGDRATEELLEHTTREHLNAIAGKLTGRAAAHAAPAPIIVDPVPQRKDQGAHKDEARPGDGSPAATRRLLDLPKDGDRRPEDDGRKP